METAAVAPTAFCVACAAGNALLARVALAYNGTKPALQQNLAVLAHSDLVIVHSLHVAIFALIIVANEWNLAPILPDALALLLTWLEQVLVQGLVSYLCVGIVVRYLYMASNMSLLEWLPDVEGRRAIRTAVAATNTLICVILHNLGFRPQLYIMFQSNKVFQHRNAHFFIPTMVLAAIVVNGVLRFSLWRMGRQQQSADFGSALIKNKRAVLAASAVLAAMGLLSVHVMGAVEKENPLAKMKRFLFVSGVALPFLCVALSGPKRRFVLRKAKGACCSVDVWPGHCANAVKPASP